METPRTLLEAIRTFADKQVAHDFFVGLRWPNGIACPRHGCGSADVAAIKKRNAWRCRECNRQFTAKVGTIFEDSPIGFDKWLPAMWLLSNTKNGTSSCELARALGVTQKTAWFMFHRIRFAMKTKSFERLEGYIETDETYIGGKAKNRTNYQVGRGTRKSKGPRLGKVIVMGMIQRYGGTVRAMKISQTTNSYMMKRLNENVVPGSTIYTDAANWYNAVDSNYKHYVIDHAVRYVEGHVHTNTIENFWSCLKRTLGGTYICARPKHIDAYLDEQVFRFNNRTDNDGGRFVKALKGADSRRLTWQELTRRAD